MSAQIHGAPGRGAAPVTATFHFPPLPSAAKINKAIEELSTWNWEVKHDRIGRRFTAGGPSIDHLTCVPLVSMAGDQMGFARTVLAHSLVAVAERISPDFARQVVDDAKANHSDQAKACVYKALTQHVRDRVIAIASHGGPGPLGEHLTGPPALLNLVGSNFAYPTFAAKEKSPALHDASLDPGAPPSKAALVRAWKYITSNALGVRVKVSSDHPLSLVLVSDEFKSRFDEIAAGTIRPGGDAETAAARSLVLNTMIDVVDQADIAGLRVWLPTIDADLIFDPSRRGEVLLGYESMLFRRLRQVVDSSGHLGLTALRDHAYFPDAAEAL